MTMAEEAAPAPAKGIEGGEEESSLAREIARVLDECQLSNAVHNRKLRELSTILRSSSATLFFPSFTRTLTPLFDAPRRTVSTERAVRFVPSFACAAGGEFLVDFIRFLLVASRAAHKTARFRACQIVSEIIMRLPDDADVSDEVWDEAIDCIKERVGDKIPAVRVFAVRALSRFASDVENSDVVDLFLDILPQESNIEVRKTIVLSMPPTSTTLVAIVGCTLDVSESVRKAAYNVIASKFPLQSLSIKLRTTILQRGLADRSSSVTKECLKMLKVEWLAQSCNGDPMSLLRFLDVETYESVGEAVMKALLEAGIVKVQGSESIRQITAAVCHTTDGQSAADVKLIEPEAALYWRMLCRHLQLEAQVKGSDAATTMGAEAAVYASQASINNDLLEDVLPATVSDYVELVNTHLAAGPNFRFVSRQLLLLGAMLDFSDSNNRKVASVFVHDLLHRPFEHETDDEGNEIVIGDGINLGGDRDWARAVSELAKKVHASAGEFEEKIALVIEELARPCRERSADFLQWMHCLAVTGLLLENIESFRCLQGKAVEPNELLHSLLLAGAKHIHIDVQRVAIRCLCLFGLLERRPSAGLVKQLRLSYITGPSLVSVLACKALVDLSTWHGTHELDNAISLDQSHTSDQKGSFIPIDLNADEDVPVGLLDLLYCGLKQNEPVQGSECDDLDTVQAIIGEGFAKILLLSANYPSISTSLHPIMLSRLILLYFTSETEELVRLKQCLSVFFEHYPALSGIHKRCVSRAFIPVMRSMWPGIHGNPGGSGIVISRMRKRATRAAQFMLQMMQTPLLSSDPQEDQCSEKSLGDLSNTTMPSLDIDSANEGLAIRIAAEVAYCSSTKKTASGKSYILALCGIIALLNFRSTEQDAIKFMRGILNCVIERASVDKEAVKDLTRLSARLEALDKHPDEELSQERAKDIIDKLDLDVNLEDVNLSMSIPPTPSAPRSIRAALVKRRARQETSSDEEASPVNNIPTTPATIGTRSQRASKTAAMSRMTACSNAAIPELEDDGGSDLTSEEDADEASDESA